MTFRIIAHILCIPYCLVALDALIFWTWTAINETSAPGILLVLPFLAYYFIPSIFGIVYFVLCQAAIVAAWKAPSSASSARRWLVAYNAVLLLYFGYLLWWFATGQHAKPVGGYL